MITIFNPPRKFKTRHGVTATVVASANLCRRADEQTLIGLLHEDDGLYSEQTWGAKTGVYHSTNEASCLDLVEETVRFPNPTNG